MTVAVQEYLGHTTLTTTQGYVRSTGGTVRRAIRRGLYRRRTTPKPPGQRGPATQEGTT